MQMVAAARLRRAEQRIQALRPYADVLTKMTRQAAEAAGNVPQLPILQEREEQKNIGLVLIAGDRGLSGSFNSQIIRQGLRRFEELKEEGKDVTLYAVGRRIDGSLNFRNLTVQAAYTGFTDRPAFSDARNIAEELMADYIDEQDRLGRDRLQQLHLAAAADRHQPARAAAAAGRDPRRRTGRADRRRGASTKTKKPKARCRRSGSTSPSPKSCSSA